ncbi:hypothetical protein Noda2021_04130 [Candidatus Dependentiae bacterium Noda2021]|nr:hypothetical protein Noda2021_04130 [Candidatus Dependentiae bacterium Noda2021]
MNYYLTITLMFGLSTSCLFSSETLEKVKLLQQQGTTVRRFYKQKLDRKVQEGLYLLKKNFAHCHDMWPAVNAALEDKINKVQAAQKAPYITASSQGFGHRALALQELQLSGVNPNTVHVQFVPQNCFAHNYYDEDMQQYILSFDNYSAQCMSKQHFRAAVNHEISHIKKNDHITKKFLFNMLVCSGQNPSAVKNNASWILFNHALEHRADILPLFKSAQHAQDMLSLMGDFYEQAKAESSEHFMTPSHPSLEKRYKKMETAVAYIKAEEQLTSMPFNHKAVEA